MISPKGFKSLTSYLTSTHNSMPKHHTRGGANKITNKKRFQPLMPTPTAISGRVFVVTTGAASPRDKSQKDLGRVGVECVRVRSAW